MPIKDWGSYEFYKVILNVSVEYYRYVEEDYQYEESIAVRFAEEHGPSLIDQFFDENGVPYFPDLGFFTLDTGYDEVCKRLYENASSYLQK